MAGVDWVVAARLRMAVAHLVAAISVMCGWGRMIRRRRWSGAGLRNGSALMEAVKAWRDGEGRVWTVRGGPTRGRGSRGRVVAVDIEMSCGGKGSVVMTRLGVGWDRV